MVLGLAIVRSRDCVRRGDVNGDDAESAKLAGRGAVRVVAPGVLIAMSKREEKVHLGLCRYAGRDLSA